MSNRVLCVDPEAVQRAQQPQQVRGPVVGLVGEQGEGLISCWWLWAACVRAGLMHLSAQREGLGLAAQQGFHAERQCMQCMLNVQGECRLD